jgi:phosphatidate cytidylyltransferase
VILCLALWGILFYCIKNSKLFLRLHSYYILDVFGLILFPTFGWCLVSLFPNFFTIVLLVASVDSFAYFSGKLFGKTKFAPSISPNKTWEGVLGGVIITCLLSVIYLFIVDATSINIVLCIIFIAILSAVSIFGDLVESMIKRFAKVKDSGNIIPGHGGFFDRLDALVVSLPLFWIATQYIPAIHMYFVSF